MFLRARRVHQRKRQQNRKGQEIAFNQGKYRNVIDIIHNFAYQLAATELIRCTQRVHGASCLRVRHQKHVLPVHLPYHRGNFRFELEASEKQPTALLLSSCAEDSPFGSIQKKFTPCFAGM